VILRVPHKSERQDSRITSFSKLYAKHGRAALWPTAVQVATSLVKLRCRAFETAPVHFATYKWRKRNGQQKEADRIPVKQSS
jgi:hypothetical protein